MILKVHDILYVFRNRCKINMSKKLFKTILQGIDGLPGEPGQIGQKGENAFISANYVINVKGEPGPRGEPGR